MNTPQRLDLPDGDVDFFASFFDPESADRLFHELLTTITWRQDSLALFGKAVALPRLTAWYGDAGTAYTYSGILNSPLPWTTTLLEVKQAIESIAGVVFNSVLLNRYRTGQDSIGWHSDDEPEFGENPVIASVSFGSPRTFQFRHRSRKALRASIELTHGSLLMMRGSTQHHWRHQIPKTAKPVGERINLTFRVVRPRP